MKSKRKAAGKAASKLISEGIAELGDWKGDTLAKMRALIREADPDVVEEWKWGGTPVWSHDGASAREREKNVASSAFQVMEKGPNGTVVRTYMVTEIALLTFCDHRIALTRVHSITT